MNAEHRIHIHVTPQQVWSVLTDIDRWPQWQAAVSNATLDGALQPGSTFRWKAGGLNLTSRLTEVQPLQRIAWQGRGLGSRAEHGWSLQPQGEGAEVTTAETMRGWLPRLIGLVQPAFLDKTLQTVLAELKAEVERRHPSPRHAGASP
ncbi:MAG: SRPBCC family protein [Pseudomonadota bacterium]|nr:SRPBCC family protein [Pseudomonadota bacterium]